jgi:hypothetical protein
MPDGVTADEKLRQCIERQREIEEEMDVHAVWECEIRAELKQNNTMRQFFENTYNTGPIHPRLDCFFGGRTECFKLLSRAEEGFKISYKDFNSLYPYVCYTTQYPIKHPKVIVFDEPMRVNWAKAEDNPYKGLLKVRVTPPQALRVPVLPMRIDQRLLFCLCRTCASNYPKGAYIPNYCCTHSASQREFVSTCTHMELNAALEDGYTVSQVYRVWQYEEWSDQLIKPYIRDFYKIKTQASGWPHDCQDCEEKGGLLPRSTSGSASNSTLNCWMTVMRGRDVREKTDATVCGGGSVCEIDSPRRESSPTLRTSLIS